MILKLDLLPPINFGCLLGNSIHCVYYEQNYISASDCLKSTVNSKYSGPYVLLFANPGCVNQAVLLPFYDSINGIAGSAGDGADDCPIFPTKAFNKLDLPTLGRPTMATQFHVSGSDSTGG